MPFLVENRMTSQEIEPWAPAWKTGVLAFQPSQMDESSSIRKDENNSQVLIKVRNIYNEFELVDWNFEEVLKKFWDQVIWNLIFGIFFDNFGGQKKFQTCKTPE